MKVCIDEENKEIYFDERELEKEIERKFGQKIGELIVREVKSQIERKEFELYKENLRLKDMLLKERKDENI